MRTGARLAPDPFAPARHRSTRFAGPRRRAASPSSTPWRRSRPGSPVGRRAPRGRGARTRESRLRSPRPRRSARPRVDRARPARAAARGHRRVQRAGQTNGDRVVTAETATQQRAPREQTVTSEARPVSSPGSDSAAATTNRTFSRPPLRAGLRRDGTPRPSPRRWRRFRGQGLWARGPPRREPHDRHPCPRRWSPARGGQRVRRPSRRPPRTGGVRRRSESCAAAYPPVQDRPIGDSSGSAASSTLRRWRRFERRSGRMSGSRRRFTSGTLARSMLPLASRSSSLRRRPDLVVEHIGSTSVPGLPGKGIVDLSIQTTPDDIPGVVAMLYELGFGPQPGPDPWPATRPMPVGSLELDGRHYRIHLHVQPVGGDFPRDLAFRDALRNDPELRRQYEDLKLGITERRGRRGAPLHALENHLDPRGLPPARLRATADLAAGDHRHPRWRAARTDARARGPRPWAIASRRSTRTRARPCGAVADRIEVGAFDDIEAAQRMAAGCAIVTYELEHVGPAVVAALDDPEAADPARPVPAQAHGRPSRRAPLCRGKRGPRRGVARG